MSKTPVRTERRMETEVRREQARVEGTEESRGLDEGGKIRREPGSDEPAGIGERER